MTTGADDRIRDAPATDRHLSLVNRIEEASSVPFGGGGLDRQVGVVPAHQGLVQRVRQAEILHVTHALRIEREHLAAIDEHQVRLGGRVIPAHGGDQHERDDNERSQQAHSAKNGERSNVQRLNVSTS